jgi:hypothetical protein
MIFKEQTYFYEKRKDQKRFVPILERNEKPQNIYLTPIDKQHNREVLKLLLYFYN